MPWTFYNSNGPRLSSAATNISVLDIDGADEMGAAIVDADLLIIDDADGGNKSVLASRIKTYVAVPAQAGQTAIEAETNQDTYIPPDLIKHSPGVAKAWCHIAADGTISGSTSYPNSYNIASITDTGTGDRTINWDVDFSQTVYAVAGSWGDNTTDGYMSYITYAAGSIRLILALDAGGNTDVITSQVAFGDQ